MNHKMHVVKIPNERLRIRLECAECDFYMIVARVVLRDILVNRSKRFANYKKTEAYTCPWKAA